MKIGMIGSDFNRILRVCKPCTVRHDTREMMQYICIKCKDGNGVATSLDGHKMAQCDFGYSGDDGEMLMPVFNLVPSDSYVTISSDGQRITVDASGDAVTRTTSSAHFFDVNAIIKSRLSVQRKTRLHVNLENLKSALNGLSGNAIIDVARDIDSILIQAENGRALVLPLSPRVQDSDYSMFGGES